MSSLPWLEIGPPPQRWVAGVTANRVKISILQLLLLLLLMDMAVNTRRSLIPLVMTPFVFLYALPDAHWIPHMVSLRIFCISVISSPWSLPLALHWGLPIKIRTNFLSLLWLQPSVFELGPAPRLWAPFFLAVPWCLPKTLPIQRDLWTPRPVTQRKTMLTWKATNYPSLQNRDLNWHL